MANEDGIPCNLKKTIECLGIQELKSKQIESIESFVSGRDTFVSLPTGYGSIILVEVVCRFSKKGHTFPTLILTYSHLWHLMSMKVKVI